MYLIQCVNAYTAIMALEERECDYKTAHALVMMKRKLQPHIEFFTKHEMRLVEEYARRGEDGKIELTDRGSFVFADPTKAAEYARRRTDLGMVDVGEDITPLCVPAPAAIRPAHLEALEGFLKFEDGEA